MGCFPDFNVDGLAIVLGASLRLSMPQVSRDMLIGICHPCRQNHVENALLLANLLAIGTHVLAIPWLRF